ncbi:MAG: hypothetical protein ACD_20C00198G0008 [uncultured bacterium]|nr:MAG: hypothetical protein ACD_20C00198G0008 [uncultured bacterium]
MSVISKRIDYKEKEKAQSAIRLLDDIKSRKRAYVSLLALNSLISYLKDRGISVNKTNNCWNNPLILNEFDIADIKLDNNISIDVRTIVDDKYPQMWIPKDHRAYDLSPDIYVGARVNKKLDRVELIGFIESKELLIAAGNKNYFFVDSTDLRPISDLLAAINTITPKQSIHLSLDHNNAKELFLSYLDNTLSGLNKEFLIKHLARCESCREEFYVLYNLNKNVSCIDKKDLLYYFNLKDYEGELPKTPVSRQNYKYSKNKTSTPGIIGMIKNMFTKESRRSSSQYIGLTSIINPADSEMEFSIPEIIEEPGIEDALDVLFKPLEDNQHNNDNNEEDVLEELEKGSQQEEQRAENTQNSIVEETMAPCFEEHLNENLDNQNEPTIKEDHNISEPELQIEESDEIFLELPSIEFNETQEGAPDKTFSEVNFEEEYIDLGTDEEEKIFRNLANKVQHQDTKFNHQDNPLNKTHNKPVILKTTLEQTKLFEYQYKLLEKQHKFENLKHTETDTQKTSQTNENIEDILASIDDIEIIDSSEAAKALNSLQDKSKNTKQATPEATTIIEIDKCNKKAQLIKVASVLAAAGVLTCTGLVVGNHMTLNNRMSDAALAQKPQVNNEIPKVTHQQRNIAPIVSTENQQEAQSLPNLKDHLASAANPENPAQARNINDVLANAFVSQGQRIRISNISWEVGVSVANDPAFKNYLMVTGQVMKMALSRELLSATDNVSNDKIKVQVTMDLTGNIQNSKIKLSSGSKQIDGIVLQTIKETFNYTKLPAIQTTKKNITTDIIINL